jgi:hypothetical protein
MLERFEMLDKVATEDDLSDTPRNIFNFDERGMQISNKPDTKITENGSKSIHVLTS